MYAAVAWASWFGAAPEGKEPGAKPDSSLLPDHGQVDGHPPNHHSEAQEPTMFAHRCSFLEAPVDHPTGVSL